MGKEVDPVSSVKPNMEAGDSNSPWLVTSKALETARAVMYTSPAWFNLGAMVGLIFGGCCSNVRKTQRELIIYTQRRLLKWVM